MPVTPETGQSELLLADEVARRLRVTPRLLRKLCETGEMTYVQLSPRTRRFRPADVEAFLQASMRSTSS